MRLLDQTVLPWRMHAIACAVALAALSAMGCRRQAPEALLAEARALQDSGDFAGSLEPLGSVLSQQPENPEASYREGLALVRTGSPSQAIWYLRKVPLSTEFGIEAGTLLASTLLETVNNEEAVAAASRVLEAIPGDGAALEVRARANLNLKKFDLALADTDKLLEGAPDVESALGIRAFALTELGRTSEARAVLERLRDVAAPPTAARACFAAAIVGREEKDVPLALEQIRTCSQRYQLEADAFEGVADYLDAHGQSKEATALLLELINKQPDKAALRGALARRLLDQGHQEEGLKAVDEFAKRAQAPGQWLSVGAMRNQAGQKDQAMEAYKEALALDPRLEAARLAVADLLIDQGKLDEAERSASEFQEKVYGDLILGRVALARGDARRALSLMEAVLGQLPDNESARLLAARAALQLGQSQEALKHLREAARLNEGSDEVAVFLARLYLARGEYEEASAIAQMYLAQQVNGAAKRLAKGKGAGQEGQTKDDLLAKNRAEMMREAYTVLARALASQGSYEPALHILAKLAEQEGSRGLAVAEAAKVTRTERGVPAAIAFIDERKLDWTDPSNEIALRQLGEFSIEVGQGDRYRALVERLARENPSRTHLQIVLATVAVTESQRNLARAALDRTLAQQPDNVEALAARGNLAEMEGHHDEAISFLDRAHSQRPADSAIAYELARTLLAAGRTDDAEAKLRQIVVDDPGNGPAANDLAWLLADQGKDLPLAADLADRAARLLPLPEVKDTLGFVQLKQGNVDAAVQTLTAAVDQKPEYGTARYHLALAFAKKGETDRARQELQSALGGPGFPESGAAKLELARLESTQ